MTNKKYAIALTIVLATCAFLTISYYKRQNLTLHPSFKTSSMQNLHLVHREDSTVKWELRAKEAVFPSGEKEIVLTALGLRIVDTPEILLSSESGVYKVEKGDVILSKAVELSMKETKFRTDTLYWNSKEDLITTDNDVTFTGKNFIIEGTGLSAVLKQQKVKILKNVKATFNTI